MNVPPAPARAPVRAVAVPAARAGALAFVTALAFAGAMSAVDAVSLDVGLAHSLRAIPAYLSLLNAGTVVVQGQLLGSAASLRVGVVPMAGTGLALWVLFKGTRRPDAFDRTRDAIAFGAFAGSVYAALIVTVCAVGVEALAMGSVNISVAIVPTAVGAVVLGVAAGVAGALEGRRGDGAPARLRAVAAGAWTMALAGTTAAFLALMLLAAIAPAYSRVYLAGFRSARADGGVAALAHNAALLPNESVWALTTSMGACTGIHGSIDLDVVCWDRFPSGSTGETLAPGVHVPRLGSIPLELLIFALVPPVSVLAGGRAVSRTLGGRRREAALRGALAGIVFAPMAVILAWIASLRVAASGFGSVAGSVLVGPRLMSVALVALAWGVPGGAAGAWFSARLRKGQLGKPPVDAR